MTAKQKIVQGRGPSNINVGIFVCSFDVCRDYYTTLIGAGAEKDNRLLFREQTTLLFSKSKMAATNFSQSGGELRIQDGGSGSQQ